MLNYRSIVEKASDDGTITLPFFIFFSITPASLSLCKFNFTSNWKAEQLFVQLQRSGSADARQLISCLLWPCR